MADLLMFVLLAAAFAIAFGYVAFCEHITIPTE
jgi:hypothetical protein